MARLGKPDEKTLTKRAARTYLQEHHPEEMNQFDDAYDVLYHAIHEEYDGLVGEDLAETQSVPEGLAAADEVLVAQTLIAACTWTSWVLTRVALKYVTKYKVLPALDAWCKTLSKITGRPEMVERLRQIIDAELRQFLGDPRNDTDDR